MGVDQQAQHDKHHNLHQPRHTIEEGHQVALVWGAVIAHHKSGDIYRQITIAAEQIGEREDEETEREKQHRV